MTSQYKKYLTALPATALLCSVFSGHATEVVRDFHIKAQPLAKSLIQFSKNADIVVSVSPELAAKFQSPEIQGEMTPSEALVQLLAGTNLTYEYITDSAVIVKEVAEDGTSSRSEREKSDRESQVEEVVVTGSRISRTTNFDTPTPMQVLDQQMIENSGFNNLGDILLNQPTVGLGRTLSSSQEGPETGATFIELRSLGTNRTLTLINGRRRVSGSALSSAVDLSAIPAALVDRIDIITGGASAVYGADAVSGVLNVKLKKNYEGVEISARTTRPEDSGSESYNFSFAAGGSFAQDRGSISVGITHTSDDPMYWGDRGFSQAARAFVPNPANTGPNDGIPDQIAIDDYRFRTLDPAGAFTINGVNYIIDPVLRPMEHDQIYNGFWASGGDGYNQADYFQLRAGLQSTSAITYFNYELTDDVNLFADINFAHTNSLSRAVPTFDFGTLTLSRDNAFIPDELGALMDANSLTSLTLGRLHLDHGNVFFDNTRDTYTIVTGLSGKLADRFNWETFYQYGEHRGELHIQNTHVRSRFLDAVDSVIDPVTGEPVCRSEAARADGCVALNVLGRNVATPEALAYFQHTRVTTIRNTQQVAGASLSGELFDLPAGPFSVAVGGEYRKEGIHSRDDGLAILGLLDPAFGSGSPSLDANFEVKEGYLEILAPIIANIPLIQSLNFESAIRYSDYNTIGSTTAWKFGADWSVIDSLRLRGTRSRAVRAPNLHELYSPGVASALSVNDPCDALNINDNPNRLANCRALGIPEGWTDPEGGVGADIVRTGGNPDLMEETSNSWTVGLVFQPEFISGLRASVDYWHITIDGAIQRPPVRDIIDKCVDSDSLDNPFCPLIYRDDRFSVEEVSNTQINVGELVAEGIDLQLGYSFPASNIGLPLAGEFSLSWMSTYMSTLEELVDASDPGSLLISDGEPIAPHWRVNTAIRYNHDKLGLEWRSRYISSTFADVQRPDEYFDNGNISSRLYHDLHMSYQVSERYSVSMGINNLLNTEPPNHPYTQSGTSGRFDQIGRTFMLSAKISL